VNYLEQPLGGFLDSVASGEPAPSGGGAAAVAVALAAGLSGMSARLSADHLLDAAGLAERADHLRQRVAPLAQEDASAYGRVLAAQHEDGDPEDRRERLREALSVAADVPLAIAEAGAEVAEIAARLAREGNPNLRGDAVALLAEAGVRAAEVLVRINTAAGGSSTTGSGVQASSPRGPAGPRGEQSRVRVDVFRYKRVAGRRSRGDRPEVRRRCGYPRRLLTSSLALGCTA
jgi:methenyltetrahydrofolate cyclohydrolase